MKPIRKLLDQQGKMFKKGGPFERFYPLYEAGDTFLFTPGSVTREASHVRDGLDTKRMMSTVVIALIPTILMAMYNTGLQANLALQRLGQDPTGWRASIMEWLGLGFSPESILACTIYGSLFFFPVLIVSYTAGGLWEALFAIVRKHDINEGFLVTGLLFPLVLPPTIPLWQVAVGISFGVVLGKEVFGGTGMNVLNPALTARAFLYFAYPVEISGDKVWTAVDGHTGATLLAVAKSEGLVGLKESAFTWWDAFLGFIPGSMGETSTLACIIGAVILLLTQVASWRTMLGMLLGAFFTVLFFNWIGSDTNPMFQLPFYWHFVVGGFAFALVYMATDPVSSAATDTGRWIYGALIGVIGIMIRELNPAYAGSWMLAILFMNMFAPLIDYYVIKANIKRRMVRYAATT